MYIIIIIIIIIIISLKTNSLTELIWLESWNIILLYREQTSHVNGIYILHVSARLVINLLV